MHVDEGLPCTVGRRVGVGHRVILHGCTIDDECLIGMGAVLLNGVRIGSGSVVAAGAVIPEGMQVPPRSVVMGVPGRIVRTVDAMLAQRIVETWAHYDGQAREHRDEGRLRASPRHDEEPAAEPCEERGEHDPADQLADGPALEVEHVSHCAGEHGVGAGEQKGEDHEEREGQRDPYTDGDDAPTAAA